MYPSKYILTKYFFTTFSVMPIKTNHIFTFSEENVFIHAKLLVTISFYYSILSRPPVENHESVLLKLLYIFLMMTHRCRLSLELERVSLSLSHTHTIALVSHPCTPLRRAGASSQADRCTWRCRSGFCRPFLWRRSRPARPCTRPGLQRERERERSNDYHLHSCVVCVCVCV